MSGNVSTNIQVFSNISFPFDNSHVRLFGSKSSQTTFFDNLPKSLNLDNYKYTRVDDYEFTIRYKGNGKINNAQHMGYLRLKNLFDDPNKWYYAFISKVKYIDDLTIELNCSVDFFQTYWFDVNILPSFVERHHTRLYESDGQPVINTVPEDLHYGGEYRIASTRKFQFTNHYMLCMVATKRLGETTYMEVDRYVGTPTPLYYYMIPYSLNDKQSITIINGDKSGFAPNLFEIFKELQGSKDFVNTIVSLYTTLYTGIPFEKGYDPVSHTLSVDKLGNIGNGIVSETIKTGGNDSIILRCADKDVFDTFLINNSYDKYTGVPNYKESKLKMSPYTMITLTDFKGNQVDYKPEFLTGKNIDLRCKGSLGTQNKVSYYMHNYISNSDDYGYLHSLIDENPNNIPLLSEYIADYLQGNSNSINTKMALSERNRNVEIGTGAINMIPSLFTGGIGASFGVSGFVSGAINAENRHYNEVKMLEAKQSDIENRPPNASNMSGNTSYEWGNRMIFPTVVIKTVTPEYEKKISDYFGMYGYQVNELTQPNLHTRRYWNYVKCVTLNVNSGMNREIILKIKAMFESGITLWHDDNMFNYNRNNEVI